MDENASTSARSTFPVTKKEVILKLSAEVDESGEKRAHREMS